MKVEARLFLAGVLFFVPIALVYWFWSGHEPVGTVGLALTGALVGMIGGYFALLGRRIDARPEDDPRGDIVEGAGEQGVFSPWSWWPLVLAASAAIVFFGLAVAFWLIPVGVVAGAVGLVGFNLEYSRGPHAH